MKRAIAMVCLLSAFLVVVGAPATAAPAPLVPALLAPAPLAAQPARQGETAVSTKELIAHARDWEGMEVVFEGEAIGDPMRRGDHAWVNVLDPNAAMGVFMPASELALIRNYGSNKGSGDRLRVRGVFHRACPDHGGDMDIHAISIEVLAGGHATPHPIDRVKLTLVPLSFVVAGLLYFLWKRREAAAKAGKGPFGK